MIGNKKGHAEPGNIQRSRIITRPVPQTVRIRAAEPWPPVQSLLAIRGSRRRIRFRGQAAVWTRMAGATRVHLARPDAQHMAFVLEDAPQLAPHRVIVPPVPKAPPRASAPPNGF